MVSSNKDFSSFEFKSGEKYNEKFKLDPFINRCQPGSGNIKMARRKMNMMFTLMRAIPVLFILIKKYIQLFHLTVVERKRDERLSL